jgi:hypothetical protein
MLVGKKIITLKNLIRITYKGTKKKFKRIFYLTTKIIYKANFTSELMSFFYLYCESYKIIIRKKL